MMRERADVALVRCPTDDDVENAQDCLSARLKCLHIRSSIEMTTTTKTLATKTTKTTITKVPSSYFFSNWQVSVNGSHSFSLSHTHKAF